MKVKFSLIENKLTPDPNDYRARVHPENTLTVEDIINTMTGHGSTVTKAESLAVIEEYNRAIFEALSKGHNVQMPEFTIGISIRGVFNSKKETFNGSKHKVELKMNPKGKLKEAIKTITLQKVKAPDNGPLLEMLKDLMSGTENELLTPGGIAHIEGQDMKFDASDPAQGIFLMAGDKTETKVETIARNMPSELIFMVPALAPGTYDLELRSIAHKGKTLRTGELAPTLTVA